MSTQYCADPPLPPSLPSPRTVLFPKHGAVMNELVVVTFSDVVRHLPTETLCEPQRRDRSFSVCVVTPSPAVCVVSHFDVRNVRVTKVYVDPTPGSYRRRRRDILGGEDGPGPVSHRWTWVGSDPSRVRPQGEPQEGSKNFHP